MGENYNPYSFISTDIIVWNGIITQYGSVAHLITEGDNLKKASADEVKTYKELRQ